MALNEAVDAKGAGKNEKRSDFAPFWRLVFQGRFLVGVSGSHATAGAFVIFVADAAVTIVNPGGSLIRLALDVVTDAIHVVSFFTVGGIRIENEISDVRQSGSYHFLIKCN